MKKKSRIPVLMYHNVGIAPRGSNPILTVSASEFRKQLEWLLRNNYRPISDRELCQWLEDENYAFQAEPVLITFDDAYSSLHSVALPLVRELGISATVFVVTSRVGGESDWDSGAHSPMPLMTREEIQYWHREGISFGGHSRTHPYLAKSSIEGLEDEIGGCAADLESLLGEKPVSFAYPYGSYNEASAAVALKFFRAAFTIDTGLVEQGSDSGRLKRLWVFPNHSMTDLRCQLAFGKNPVYGLKQRWRRLLK